MGLIDIAAKCRALYRMYLKGHKDGTSTANWMRVWILLGRRENPPQARHIPQNFAYLQYDAIDMAYVQQTELHGTPTGLRKHIYNTLLVMARAANDDSGVRIMTMHPTESWDTIWKNLHDTWTPLEIRSTWFQVIHDLIPTNARLARIRLCDTDKCPCCGRMDTLLHRLTECHVMADVWSWTRERIALMLRTDPRHIPPKWTIRPVCNIWSPQRKGAILWLIAHMVWYTIASNTDNGSRAQITRIS